MAQAEGETAHGGNADVEIDKNAAAKSRGMLATLAEALRRESLPARGAAGLAFNRACATDAGLKQAYKA